MPVTALPLTATSPTTSPYFYEQTLRQRFSQDVKFARGSSRIDVPTEQRLLRLLNETTGASDSNELLRVDRIVMDDGTPTCAELASAWLISDPTLNDGPVYLHTLMFGLEQFKDRQQVLDILQLRFAADMSPSKTLDREKVDGSLIEQRMLTILEQQARHLQSLTARLQKLPQLHDVVGQTLQEQIRSRQAGDSTDVFSHLVQRVRGVPTTSGEADASRVISSMTLAEAALHEYMGETLPAWSRRQFLDERGGVLSAVQAAPYSASLAAVRPAVLELYERQLSEFWSKADAHGRTARQHAAQTLSESYRHALLRCREERTLLLYEFRQLRNLLPSPSPEAATEEAVVSRISVSTSGNSLVKLAGIFLIEFPFGNLPILYLYSSQSGLSRLLNQQALADHFTTDAGRTHLAVHTSLEDRPLVGDGAVTLVLDSIEGSLFLAHIDSVIAVQKRNLRYTLGLPLLGREQVAARVDDALDIRGMLDWRLLSLTDSGRWLADSPEFDKAWPSVSAALSPPLLQASHDLSGSSWVRRIQDLDQRMEELGSVRPGIHECAARVLDRYLTVLGEPQLKAQKLWVQHVADGPYLGLIELFLGRVNASNTARIPSTSLIYRESGELAQRTWVNHLPVALLNHVLDKALPGFDDAYAQQVRGFHRLPLRLPNRQLRPRVQANRYREDALRLELSIEYRIQQLGQNALDMIQQVVDRPLDTLRRFWGDSLTLVNRVQLNYSSTKPALAMTNAFVLHQPKKPGSHVFWSAHTGFKVCASLLKLEEYLVAELKSHRYRQRWLDLFGELDKAALSAHVAQFGVSDITLQLHVIEGHFIEKLQAAEVERQAEAIIVTYKRALRWHGDTVLFSRLLRLFERIDRNRDAMDSLAVGLERILFKALLPPWLETASRKELREFLLVARHLYVVFDEKKNFLFDIPELSDYARDELATRLNTDFPDIEIDPEEIVVTLAIYTPMPVPIGSTPSGLPAASSHVSERLPDFAINRFADVQQGVLNITLVNHHGDDAATAAFTADYIRDMVSSLDVGGSYQRLLDKKLDAATSDFAMRKEYYVLQHPPMERLAALQARIKGELSAQAYQFIEAVLFMPDALARLPVNGKKIVLSPLQLLAEKGATPDLVTGVFIIAPEVPQSGPWVLYALLSDDFLFKEYTDQDSLLSDIRTSASVQSLILERVSAGAHKLYAHGGFSEPHLPFSTEAVADVPLVTPAPVTLQVTPSSGNALHQLFASTLETLKLLVKLWSVTSSQSDRASTLHLLNLVVAQGMVFLPGRIGVMIGLWQSESLLKDAFNALKEANWGEAAGTFSAALGTLVLSGEVPEESVVDLLSVDDTIELQGPSTLPEFGWSKGSLTAQQVGMLSRFAVDDIDLSELTRDELLNVYEDSQQQQYAAVAGVVYRVRRSDNVWRIVGDDATGPAVRINTNQQWELDLPWGLKGGGGIVTRMRSSVLDMQINSVCIVEAQGIPAIRLRFRDHSRHIAEAHSQARYYLENCLDNINVQSPGGSIDTRAKQIISDFFGVTEPGEQLYGEIRKSVSAMFSALMDPTLSPFNSERYVVVSNRLGFENSRAFIFPNDPQKRIFLSDEFFRVPYYRFKWMGVHQAAFNHGAHSRGATLLHELSHLTGNTEDIAYVESSAPFVDLLDDSTAYRRAIKDKLAAVRDHGLSHLTSPNELFKSVQDGSWHDLTRGESDAKVAVLRITGKSSLAEARTVFYNDAEIRSKIILNNADSVALLVTLLGRYRFAP